ncbi:hypothetical protein E3U43_009395 [Larimichthys crocea]|uniref:Uncharacterized protein n=1 Tax=Larimichthys crocea TaxID=215358 RepID=A0ACD3QCJ1_LARCR|nr:hypothetical protein E3U43_009395 [Larimichthys crocea]
MILSTAITCVLPQRGEVTFLKLFPAQRLDTVPQFSRRRIRSTQQQLPRAHRPAVSLSHGRKQTNKQTNKQLFTLTGNVFSTPPDDGCEPSTDESKHDFKFDLSWISATKNCCSCVSKSKNVSPL